MDHTEIGMDMRTPIEIALNIDKDGMTTAKKLYEFLELDKTHYSRWIKSNIIENDFAEEDVDYWALAIDGEREFNPNPTQDFKLTAHFAKKLCQKGNGVKGEQARKYFIGIEERVKQEVIDRNQLSPQMQLMNMLVENMSRQELEQKRLAKEVEAVKQNQEAIADTFQKTNDIEDFQRWANDRIAQIAESLKFNRGTSRSQNYSLARSESYERLKRKRNCHLEDRVQKAIGRALANQPGIKRSELNKINKIYVIANDKDLRPAYELVVKEMMIAYCVDTPKGGVK